MIAGRVLNEKERVNNDPMYSKDVQYENISIEFRVHWDGSPRVPNYSRYIQAKVYKGITIQCQKESYEYLNIS